MFVRWFRLVALVEAVSYIVLLLAAVAKRALDLPQFVTVLGPVHGVIFLVYLALAIAIRNDLGWNTMKTAIVIVAAVVPFGGFYVERNLLVAPR